MYSFVLVHMLTWNVSYVGQMQCFCGCNIYTSNVSLLS